MLVLGSAAGGDACAPRTTITNVLTRVVSSSRFSTLTSPLNINRALQRASQKEEENEETTHSHDHTLSASQPLVCTHRTQQPPAQAKLGQNKRSVVLSFARTKEQINQAQALLKQRGFYSGEQVGKLDDATREGLRKYQQAEGLKVTGTLNKITLEKMNIALTEKQ
jgi:7-keto-8-aminopelargonate synthetase-like enzyme